MNFVHTLAKRIQQASTLLRSGLPPVPQNPSSDQASATRAARLWPGAATGDSDRYILNYLGRHLAAAERWDELHKLVTEGSTEWLDWAEAHRSLKGSYAGFLSDLALAWAHVDAEPGADHVVAGRQLRYALIESTLHSLANNLPGALLVALIQHQIAGWTPATALAYILQMPDERQRGAGLLALAPFLSPDLWPEALAAGFEIQEEFASHDIDDMLRFVPPELVLGENSVVAVLLNIDQRLGIIIANADSLSPSLIAPALTQILAATDDEMRVKALAALAARLPAELWPQALTAALALPSPFREELLPTLVPCVPEASLTFLLDIAESMANCESRSRLLAALGERSHPELNENLSVTVNLTKDESVHARPPGALRDLEVEHELDLIEEEHFSRRLLEITPHLPPQLVPRVLQAVASHWDPDVRAEVLTAILPRLPIDLVDNALTILENVEEGQRAGLLALLSLRLAQNPRRALNLADRIEPGSNRAAALFELAAVVAEDWRAPVEQAGLRALDRAIMDDQYWPAADSISQKLSERTRRRAWQHILAGVRRLHSEEDRARRIRALAGKLPAEFMPEATAIVLAVRDDYARCTALQEMAPYLGQRALLEKALSSADSSESTEESNRQRRDALISMLPHLPADLLPQALAIFQKLRDSSEVAQTLVHLAPYLPDTLLPYILATAAQVADHWGRYWALDELLPHLPTSLLPDALKAIQEHPDPDNQASLLIAIAPRLALEQLSDIVAQAEAITSWDSKRKALSGIAKHLPPDLQARTLEAISQMPDIYNRTQGLVCIAPGIAPGLRARLMATARRLEPYDEAVISAACADDLSPDLRREILQPTLLRLQQTGTPGALSVLSSVLTPDLIPQALTLLETTENPSVDALVGLAPHLTSDQWPRILEMAGVRRDALLALAPHIPVEFWSSVLIRANSDVSTLAALAPHMPLNILLLALSRAEAEQDTDARARQLVALLPHIPSQVKEQALTQICEARSELFGGPEAIALLAGFARACSVALQAQFLTHVLDQAEADTDHDRWCEALCHLAKLLPSSLNPTALSRALALAQAMPDEICTVTAQAALVPCLPAVEQRRVLNALQIEVVTSHWDQAKVRLFLNLVPEPPHDLVAAMMEAIFSLETDNDRLNALAELATALPVDLWATLLRHIEACEKPYERAQWFIRVASLPAARGYALSGRALASVAAIDDRQKRTMLLSALENHWPDWTGVERAAAIAAWPSLLHTLATEPRSELLRNLRESPSLMLAVAGPSALSEAGHALIDVTRWWP